MPRWSAGVVGASFNFDISRGIGQLGQILSAVSSTVTGINAQLNRIRVGNATVSSLAAISSTIAPIGTLVTNTVQRSISTFSRLQQSMQGTQTILNGQADQAIANAATAYASSGLSMSQYLENSMGMMNLLLQDATATAESVTSLTDTVMQNAGDISALYGIPAETVLGVIQSISRGIYITFDNLRLGYAGTKSGVEQMITDAGLANEMLDEMGNLNFETFLRALDITVNRLGITGAAAQLAETTIQGSIRRISAGIYNFLGLLPQESTVQTQETIQQITDLIISDVQKLGRMLIEAVRNIWNNLPFDDFQKSIAAGTVLLRPLLTLLRTFSSAVGAVFNAILIPLQTLWTAFRNVGSSISNVWQQTRQQAQQLATQITAAQQQVTTASAAATAAQERYNAAKQVSDAASIASLNARRAAEQAANEQSRLNEEANLRTYEAVYARRRAIADAEEAEELRRQAESMTNARARAAAEEAYIAARARASASAQAATAAETRAEQANTAAKAQQAQTSETAAKAKEAEAEAARQAANAERLNAEYSEANAKADTAAQAASRLRTTQRLNRVLTGMRLTTAAIGSVVAGIFRIVRSVFSVIRGASLLILVGQSANILANSQRVQEAIVGTVNVLNRVRGRVQSVQEAFADIKNTFTDRIFAVAENQWLRIVQAIQRVIEIWGQLEERFTSNNFEGMASEVSANLGSILGITVGFFTSILAAFGVDVDQATQTIAIQIMIIRNTIEDTSRDISNIWANLVNLLTGQNLEGEVTVEMINEAELRAQEQALVDFRLSVQENLNCLANDIDKMHLNNRFNAGEIIDVKEWDINTSEVVSDLMSLGRVANSLMTMERPEDISEGTWNKAQKQAQQMQEYISTMLPVYMDLADNAGQVEVGSDLWTRLLEANSSARGLSDLTGGFFNILNSSSAWEAAMVEGLGPQIRDAQNRAVDEILQEANSEGDIYTQFLRGIRDTAIEGEEGRTVWNEIVDKVREDDRAGFDQLLDAWVEQASDFYDQAKENGEEIPKEMEELMTYIEALTPNMRQELFDRLWGDISETGFINSFITFPETGEITSDVEDFFNKLKEVWDREAAETSRELTPVSITNTLPDPTEAVRNYYDNAAIAAQQYGARVGNQLFGWMGVDNFVMSSEDFWKGATEGWDSVINRTETASKAIDLLNSGTYELADGYSRIGDEIYHIETMSTEDNPLGAMETWLTGMRNGTMAGTADLDSMFQNAGIDESLQNQIISAFNNLPYGTTEPLKAAITNAVDTPELRQALREALQMPDDTEATLSAKVDDAVQQQITDIENRLSELTGDEYTVRVRVDDEDSVELFSEKIQKLVSQGQVDQVFGEIARIGQRWMQTIDSVGSQIFEGEQQDVQSQIDWTNYQIRELEQTQEEIQKMMDEWYDEHIASLQNYLEEGQISQAEYDLLQKNAEEEKLNREAEQNQQTEDARAALYKHLDELGAQQFENEKRRSRALAIINGSLTVLSTIANTPGGWVAKLIGSGLASTAVALEVKNIDNQEYVPQYNGYYAKGGVFTSPHAGIIGEAGAEAVVPLENNTRWINLVADKMVSAVALSASNDSTTGMSNTNNSQINNFTFNSRAVINEVEATRLLRREAKQLIAGFY